MAKEIENETKYYYQCQEKGCEIKTDQPMPCIIGTEIESDGKFCIHSKVCKGVVWLQISKEVYDNINMIAAIKQKECSHCSHMGNNVRICTLCVDKSEFIDKTRLIPTMRVNYFDGSYYVVRKDKPGWEDIIEKINLKKGRKFLLETPREEQLSIIKNVPLVKVTEVEMSEEDYMKIPASLEIGEIQQKQKIQEGMKNGAGFIKNAILKDMNEGGEIRRAIEEIR